MLLLPRYLCNTAVWSRPVSTWYSRCHSSRGPTASHSLTGIDRNVNIRDKKGWTLGRDSVRATCSVLHLLTLPPPLFITILISRQNARFYVLVISKLIKLYVLALNILLIFYCTYNFNFIKLDIHLLAPCSLKTSEFNFCCVLYISERTRRK